MGKLRGPIIPHSESHQTLVHRAGNHGEPVPAPPTENTHFIGGWAHTGASASEIATLAAMMVKHNRDLY